MLKNLSYPTLLLGASFLMAAGKAPDTSASLFSNQPLPFVTYHISAVAAVETGLSSTALKYRQWKLDAAGLSQQAFEYAMKGYQYLVKKGRIANQQILSIVDFSQPSNRKRLYVIDVVSGQLLFNTLLSHGKNSGNEYATHFSNQTESHQSSLGFYITMGTYFGSNGYSLKLQGCERGYNDKALERAIVIHGADYATEDFIKSNGFLGRSYGCPAVPDNMSKPIIDAVKNGSCLFIYHPNKQYLRHSKILNS